MRTPLLRRLASVALAFALPGSAVGGGVRIVTPQGDLNYPDIASAVAAAQEGDVLLVGEGDYGGFTIDGMSLSIWAAPGALVNVGGTITVRNLAAQQSVVLSGLSVPNSGSSPALRLVDVQGWARLQDCTFEADQNGGWAGSHDGAPGASVIDCPQVAFLRCLLRGGKGDMGIDWDMCQGSGCQVPSGDGGPGLSVTSSRVALYDSEVHGGEGGDVDSYSVYCCDPGRGGDGVLAAGSEVFGSATRFWGGNGGVGCKWNCIYGPPGCGVWVDGQSAVDALDCVIGGGSVKCGPGWLTPLRGTAREVLALAIVPELEGLDFELRGRRGDRVWLPRSTKLGHAFHTSLASVWLLDSPTRMPVAAPITLPAPGATHTAAPVWVPPGATHAHWALQGLFVSPGEARLGSARHVLGLSLTVGPDCNNNGVSDYIDVLFGGAPDLNHNLIPDPCPGG